ncbi:MAG: SIS domain-containing protein [Anaerolineae bacterium]|nr:SIS domain-containing protein [Anaerolineae bacterium]
MKKTAYINDILSQPEVLKKSIPQYDVNSLKGIQQDLASGKIKQVIITGMGGSLYAGYAAWLILVQHGLSATLIDAAELLHYTPQLITRDSLVWMISQSGRSAELLPLLDVVKERGARLISTTNTAQSPVGLASEHVSLILSPEELTVSTVTFTTTLANIQLSALALCAESVSAARDDLLWTADAIGLYLQNWEERVVELEKQIGLPGKLFVVGRGPSLPATLCGALIQSEAAKMGVIGLNAAEFRHGPLELGAPDLTILIMAGAQKTFELNRRLCEDLLAYQSRAFWMAPQAAENMPHIAVPAWRSYGLPVAEIIPMQLLTIALANQKNLEAGKFFHSGKITLSE